MSSGSQPGEKKDVARAGNPVRRVSAGLLAVATFASANVFLSCTQRPSLARASTYTKDDITVRACLSKKANFKRVQKPGIVLMGSSLMMAPIWRVDVQKYGATAGNTLEHSTSLYLKDLLSRSNNTTREAPNEPGIFNFSVPGAMMSDEYLFAWKYFRGEQAPNTVVVGLAPRDFMDNMVTSECRTVPYQLLLDALDVVTINQDYIRNHEDLLDVLASKAFYLYGKRSDLQNRLVYALTRQGPTSPFQNMADVTEADRGDARLDYIYGEIARIRDAEQKRKTSPEGKSVATGQFAEEIWKGCLFEYWRRYKGENKELFARQERFLESFLQLCNERDIRVILVNMPLTNANKGLMPTGVYQRYSATIASAARKFGCRLVDLDAMSFSDDQFFDPVHLNESGGSKLLQIVAHELSTDRGAMASKKLPLQ